MEQMLMSAFIFAVSAAALAAAWVSISASRVVESFDAKVNAKVAQQAALKRVVIKTSARSSVADGRQAV